MGAGQVGGLATLLDIDFNNAAGFVGVKTEPSEAQYVVYFLSHAMMFCMGSLIEAHVVLTAASCVYGEKFKFDVFGGTHIFHEDYGVPREVEHFATHRGYNHTMRWESCSPDNVALLMLGEQFILHRAQPNAEYVINRLRYSVHSKESPHVNQNCRFYGWGSRRNGYLIPLLITLQRVSVNILPPENCLKMWNWGSKYLCLQQMMCKDDLGSVIECSGFLRGMMTSRLIDRPCGVGFLDMTKYIKFLTCGVDDSRDLLEHNDYMELQLDKTTQHYAQRKKIKSVVVHKAIDEDIMFDPADPGPPTLRSTLSGECEDDEPTEKTDKDSMSDADFIGDEMGPNGSGDKKVDEKVVRTW